ncbi:MAG: hypothetical protein IIB81_04750, partial [Nanoarchaeota archaeon]|nr:hypothetical protein [Nanoarchaeota archaeon]
MYELIISEKPDAAKRIAESLADGKPIISGFVESLQGSHSSNSRIINISG